MPASSSAARWRSSSDDCRGRRGVDVSERRSTAVVPDERDAEPSSARRPTCCAWWSPAVVLVVAALISHLFGGASSEFVADLLGGLERAPRRLVTVVVALGELLGLGLRSWGRVLAVVHRRWRLLAGIAVASPLSVPLLLARRVPERGDYRRGRHPGARSGSATSPSRARRPTCSPPSSPSPRPVTPWISRRWRRAWWAAVLCVALAHLIGTPVSLETLLAVLAGWFAGSASDRRASALRRGGRPARGRRRPAVGGGRPPAPRAGGGRRPWLDARTSAPCATARAVRQGARRRRAQRRPALPPVPPHPAPGPRRRAPVLVAASHRRARGAGGRGRAAGRRAHAARSSASRPASPTGSCSPTRPIAGRSLDRRRPVRVIDAVVAEVWGQVAVLRRTASPTATCASPTCSSATTGGVDDRLRVQPSWPPTTCSWPATWPSCSPLHRVARRARTGRSPPPVPVVGPEAVRACVHRLRPALLSGATRTSLGGQPGVLDRLREMAVTV